MASIFPPVRAAAYSVTFPLYDTSGKLKTGAAFTSVQVSKDGGAFSPAANAPAELATASGVYTLALTAAEMTADTVVVKLVVSTASTQDATLILYTAAVTFDGFPANVWTYATRTLTQGASSVAATVAGTSITVYRGTAISIALTGLGNISANTKLYFTVKDLSAKTDAQALLQIEKAGLLVLNASGTVTLTDGAIAVNDATLGNITVTLKAASAAALTPGSYLYDVKMVTAAGVQELSAGGAFVVSADITRAIT